MKTKKYLLGLGIAVLLPLTITSVISCGNKSTNEDGNGGGQEEEDGIITGNIGVDVPFNNQSYFVGDADVNQVIFGRSQGTIEEAMSFMNFPKEEKKKHLELQKSIESMEDIYVDMELLKTFSSRPYKNTFQYGRLFAKSVKEKIAKDPKFEGYAYDPKTISIVKNNSKGAFAVAFISWGNIKMPERINTILDDPSNYKYGTFEFTKEEKREQLLEFWKQEVVYANIYQDRWSKVAKDWYTHKASQLNLINKETSSCTDFYITKDLKIVSSISLMKHVSIQTQMWEYKINNFDTMHTWNETKKWWEFIDESQYPEEYKALSEAFTNEMLASVFKRNNAISSTSLSFENLISPQISLELKPDVNPDDLGGFNAWSLDSKLEILSITSENQALNNILNPTFGTALQDWIIKNVTLQKSGNNLSFTFEWSFFKKINIFDVFKYQYLAGFAIDEFPSTITIRA